VISRSNSRIYISGIAISDGVITIKRRWLDRWIIGD
jgi:hypothetical protein